MTEIGQLFGVSSHVVGRWLVGIGLRTPEKFPSTKAFKGGYTNKAPNGRGSGWYYVWDRDKTVQALEEAGHRCSGDLEDERLSVPTRLVGPFVVRCRPDHGFDVVGGDDIANIQVRGQENAELLLRLLNLAHHYGKFQPAPAGLVSA
jgi:hypothetical protein